MKNFKSILTGLNDTGSSEREFALTFLPASPLLSSRISKGFKPIYIGCYRAVVLALFLLAAGFNVLAQEQTASVNSDITLSPTPISIQPFSLTVDDMLEVKLLSDDQLTAFVSSLNVTPTISFDALPRQGIGQTYFSLQHPEWPPLPGDTASVPVWPMDGFYLLDDLNHDYNPPVLLRPQMRTSFSAPAPGDGSGDGGTNTPNDNVTVLPSYGTNLWIAQVNIVSNNLTGIASNTLADVQYEIQTKTNLLQTNWLSTGSFILGSEATNWTPLNPLPVSQTNNFLMRLRSWADDGSGLPIWWQLQYFGTNGVDPHGNPAGDGWNNLQKFQKGWNPNQFYTPAAPANLNVAWNPTNGGTFLTWSPAQGAVTNYLIIKTYHGPSGAVTTTINALPTSDSFLDTVAGDTSQDILEAGPGIDVDYAVTAQYAGGNSEAGNATLGYQSPPTVITARGSNGNLNLIVSGLPADITGIKVYHVSQFGLLGEELFSASANYADTIDTVSDALTNGYFEISSSGITNGIYPIPTNQLSPFANIISGCRANAPPARIRNGQTIFFPTGK